LIVYTRTTHFRQCCNLYVSTVLILKRHTYEFIFILTRLIRVQFELNMSVPSKADEQPAIATARTKRKINEQGTKKREKTTHLTVFEMQQNVN